MFGSVCWGGNISKLDRGRLEKIVKKKKSRSCCGKATGQCYDFTRKETVQKINANIKRPYTSNETQATLIADVATGVEDFYF